MYQASYRGFCPHKKDHPAILLTGFAPFAGEQINPSWEAVKQVQRQLAGSGQHIDIAQLPVEFAALNQEIPRLIQKRNYDHIVLTGLAAGATELRLERVGLNLIDARIPDNAGRQPRDIPIIAEGPAAYFSTWEAKTILRELTWAGLPATLSTTAGLYCCNTALYLALHYAECGATRPKPTVGFVHVPRQTTLRQSEIARALRIICESFVGHRRLDTRQAQAEGQIW